MFAVNKMLLSQNVVYPKRAPVSLPAHYHQEPHNIFLKLKQFPFQKNNPGTGSSRSHQILLGSEWIHLKYLPAKKKAFRSNQAVQFLSLPHLADPADP